MEKPKTCPECGSTNVVYDKEKEQTVCRDCGAIFEELTPKEEKKFERVAKK